MTEARLVPAEEGGLVPEDGGWFVLNAKDASWLDGDLGKYTGFEGKDAARFSQLGINLNVLAPGEPMTMYHREDAQEDFLVVSGKCTLIVQGEERPLEAWDFFHCPAGVDHAIVGAGDGPSLVVAVGARTGAEQRGEHGLVYPADPTAQKHGAAVEEETSDGRSAYARFTFRRTGYGEGWLPD
jgi:mannose-6-phosphate isomerase-like protein (cupin superfamily)